MLKNLKKLYLPSCAGERERKVETLTSPLLFFGLPPTKNMVPTQRKRKVGNKCVENSPISTSKVKMEIRRNKDLITVGEYR